MKLSNAAKRYCGRTRLLRFSGWESQILAVGRVRSMSKNDTDYRWRVFLSSTFREVKAYRKAVKERCEQEFAGRIDIVALDDEEYSRVSIDPEAICKDRVKSCDLVLLLIGRELGSRSGDGDSYTEAEIK